jgi:O-antigen/teichoic acid export membrane protein
MLNIRQRLKGLAKLGKLSGGYFITTLTNNAIPFLVLPILTAYLKPYEYANIALFSFLLTLSNAITGIAIQHVISKFFFRYSKNRIANLIGHSLGLVLVFSIITLVIIALTYPLIQHYLKLDLIWLIIIPLTSFFWIVINIGLTVLRNARKVLLFSSHQISNTLINFAVSIFFVVVLLWGWQGRVWGMIISYLISAVFMLIFLHRNGFLRFSYSKAMVQRILAVVLPLIPNSFQSVVIAQVGIFFIQLYFTKELLGVYAVGFQIAFAIKLLITALQMSWTPYLYEQLAKPEAINKVHLTRLLIALFGVVLLGVLFVNLFSGFILRVMTAPEYYAAGSFIPWLTLGFLFYGLYVFLSPLLIVHEKQRFISVVSFINMVIMIFLNIGFSKLFGPIGIAYAYCLTYFLLFLSFFIKSHQIMPLPWFTAVNVWHKITQKTT